MLTNIWIVFFDFGHIPIDSITKAKRRPTRIAHLDIDTRKERAIFTPHNLSSIKSQYLVILENPNKIGQYIMFYSVYSVHNKRS